MGMDGTEREEKVRREREGKGEEGREVETPIVG